MIEQGVPLQRLRKKAATSKSRPRSGFVNFFTKKQAARTEPLTGEAFKAWRASVVAEWNAMSDEMRAVETQEGRAAHSTRALSELDAVEGQSGDGRRDDFASSGSVLRSVIAEVGNKLVPYKACLLHLPSPLFATMCSVLNLASNSMK